MTSLCAILKGTCRQAQEGRIAEGQRGGRVGLGDLQSQCVLVSVLGTRLIQFNGVAGTVRALSTPYYKLNLHPSPNLASPWVSANLLRTPSNKAMSSGQAEQPSAKQENIKRHISETLRCSRRLCFRLTRIKGLADRQVSTRALKQGQIPARRTSSHRTGRPPDYVCYMFSYLLDLVVQTFLYGMLVAVVFFCHLFVCIFLLGGRLIEKPRDSSGAVRRRGCSRSSPPSHLEQGNCRILLRHPQNLSFRKDSKVCSCVMFY